MTEPAISEHARAAAEAVFDDIDIVHFPDDHAALMQKHIDAAVRDSGCVVEVTGKTSAAKERAAVVAWHKQWEAYHRDRSEPEMERWHRMSWRAIEAGEHLKGGGG